MNSICAVIHSNYERNSKLLKSLTKISLLTILFLIAFWYEG